MPGMTGSIASVLVTARSASTKTLVSAVAMSFPWSGSGVDVATVAVLEIIAPGKSVSTWMTIVMVSTPPAPRGSITQSTTPAISMQAESVEETDTKDVLAGSVSEIITISASDGPLLVTISV